MDTELLHILKQVGFKEKKAKIYLACLEMGQANAQSIAKKAGIERTSVYAILESLQKEGLISATIKKKTKYFIADPPNKMIDLFKDKTNVVIQALPLFSSIFKNTKSKPKIKFYEDKESIKEILNDTLDSREKILRNLISIKDIQELLGNTFLIHYLEKRVKLGIMVRSLRLREKELQEKIWDFKAETQKQVLRESRFLPKNVSFDVACFIYDNKVALISSKKECFGFVIESSEFSQMMKTLYDLIWDISEVVI